MKTILEKSLFRALTDAHLSSLPEEINETTKNGWVRAIVLVQKRDCSRNYAMAENNGKGTPTIVKDFGKTSQIMKIEKIYPYLSLEKYDIPRLSTNNDYITYLTRHGYSSDEIAGLLAYQNKDGSNKSDEEIKKDRDKIDTYVNSCIIKDKMRRFKVSKRTCDPEYQVLTTTKKDGRSKRKK